MHFFTRDSFASPFHRLGCDRRSGRPEFTRQERGSDSIHFHPHLPHLWLARRGFSWYKDFVAGVVTLTLPLIFEVLTAQIMLKKRKGKVQ